MEALAISLLAALALAASAHAAPSATSAAGGKVVLGKKGLFPYGRGWGSPHPRTIFNGGAPSGLVSSIRWRAWGSGTARGIGWIPIYRPEGGYYRAKGRIQLRASDIGICRAGSPRAYRQLRARAVNKPGGHYGRWFSWAGAGDLCHWP